MPAGLSFNNFSNSGFFSPAVSAAVAASSPFFAGQTDPDFGTDADSNPSTYSISARFAFANSNVAIPPGSHPTIPINSLQRRLIGRDPLYERQKSNEQFIIRRIAEDYKHFKIFVDDQTGQVGDCFRIERKDGRALTVKVLKVTSGSAQDLVVKLGDRWYKFSSKGFNLNNILSEPVLWIGNAPLVAFFDLNKIRPTSTGESNVEAFYSNDIPDEHEVDTLDDEALTYSIGQLASSDKFLRLHAIISMVRKNWSKRGPASKEYLEALRELGTSYLQHGIYMSLGLDKQTPSLWTSDWENNILTLLTHLSSQGVRKIAIDKPRASPVEQRILIARLRSRLENMPFQEFHPSHMAALIKKGEVLGLPVRLNGDTLYIDSTQLLEGARIDRTGRSAEDNNIPQHKPLPNTSQMVLDGLFRMARFGIEPARREMDRIKSNEALHLDSMVAGYHEVHDENGEPPTNLPPAIGIIRGGFGIGGAAQEAQNLINGLSRALSPETTAIHVASGFFHPGIVLDDRVQKAQIDVLDRERWLEGITKPLFDSNSPVPPEELAKRYEAAVTESADKIADWMLTSGITVLIATQMGNPFENPITLPAIIRAREMIKQSHSRNVQLIFRHNFFRDPEDSSPRVPIWHSRDTWLDPNMKGIIHLVEGPADQNIAKTQYGINASVLPKWVKFPNIPAVLEKFSTTGRASYNEFAEFLKAFDEMIREPRARIRQHLKEKFGVPNDALLILSPSRINMRKRLDKVLELVKKIKMETVQPKKVILLVLGEGTSKVGGYKSPWSGDEERALEEFKKLIVKEGLRENVVFMGHIGHEVTPTNPVTVLDLMRSVEIVAQMSEEETFGLTYLEAIASGAIVAMSNFNYPGKYFGILYPVYRYLHSCFKVFIRYSQEGNINQGMVKRLLDILKDEKFRRSVTYSNMMSAYYSPLNEKFALAYFMNLLSKVGQS